MICTSSGRRPASQRRWEQTAGTPGDTWTHRSLRCCGDQPESSLIWQRLLIPASKEESVGCTLC